MSETENRNPYPWNISFDPRLTTQEKRRYEDVYSFLNREILSEARFNAMSDRNTPCFAASKIVVAGSPLLIARTGLDITNTSMIKFSPSAQARGNTDSQEGQMIAQIGSSWFDPACYLYGIGYEDMPIAVGSPQFVERAFSQTYSFALNYEIAVRLITM